MINIKNVTFTYSSQTSRGIKDISFHIRKGECILLCGKSGCGKTTITRLINGLIPHFNSGNKDGNVWLGDRIVDEIPMYQLAEKTASVFQNPKSQFFNLDAESEITFALENQGIPSEDIKKRLMETITVLKIDKLMKKSLFQMSGGEKQIIAFACAYAVNPDVLVLDEPSSNLDIASMNRIGTIIRKMKEEGKTIIIAEHRVAYLAEVIDRAIYIEDGSILKIWDRKDFFSIKEEQRKAMGLRQLNYNSYLGKNNLHINNSGVNQHTLKVENLSMDYGETRVFDNISFELHSGEITALIGENGIGKSTLCRVICGLRKQSGGNISIDHVVTKPKKRLKKSYIVMQDVNHQLFGESVFQECFIGNEKIERSDVEEILRDLDLIQLKDMHSQSLSGGQKQRLAVAVAILAGKMILIFDEPTSGLDYINMERVGNFIRGLSQKGYIILVITHDMEFLSSTCNRCIKLHRNKAEEVDQHGSYRNCI